MPIFRSWEKEHSQTVWRVKTEMFFSVPNNVEPIIPLQIKCYLISWYIESFSNYKWLKIKVNYFLVICEGLWMFFFLLLISLLVDKKNVQKCKITHCLLILKTQNNTSNKNISKTNLKRRRDNASVDKENN